MEEKSKKGVWKDKCAVTDRMAVTPMVTFNLKGKALVFPLKCISWYSAP